jgi:DNA/RNA endonuclease G (NUC1)
VLLRPHVFRIVLVILAVFVGAAESLAAPECPAIPVAQQRVLKKQHLGPFNPPGYAVIHRGYAYSFDPEHLVPKWVAWRVTPEYLDTPKREGKWKEFRPEPYLPPEQRIVTEDYTNSGYDRGHMAPYFISGGDRDGDGEDAEIENEKGLPVDDIDDACTVFEINYMSNITPQRGDLNSQSGTWYDLETELRKRAKAGESFQVLAGTLFLSDNPKKIGNGPRKISVPDAFYQIVDDGKKQTAYLFFQERRLDGIGGCLPKAALTDCRVATEVIAKLVKIEGRTER